ncbi:siderophore ABC transporter substrate-binding protein [Staphylococcus massiliensis]|uniref:ferrated catecholamine ABC transporter substrate-binding lipoprotein SstD n=1 Tax=Staphylococcus massiliensis TaxID=555791 RepID=UPI0003088B3A|nr:siderophore ABC transporter substrate-binding protein [Staphylococcus massiliensis]MCG3412677.1 siderophore ABC transporter substrate-binding protein [Staphylococcus massiliensis]POA01538.1 iron ABC transporter substrate-binding protein [Staphylococcus massiliensis CCUG 55927]
MKRLSFLVVICLAFLLVACGNQSSKKEEKSSEKASSEKTIKVENNFKLRDENKDSKEQKKVSETVDVPVNPEKVIVFDYGALDTLKELGVKDEIKALPKGENKELLPDFLKEFKDDKYENTGDLKTIDFDKVAKIQPDIIFLSSRTAYQKNLDEFKKAAPKAKVVYMGADDKNYLKSVKTNTDNLGKIFGKEDKAKELNQKLEDKIAGVKAKTKDLKAKGMYLLVNEGELSTYGPGDRFGSLVYDTLGFTPADTDIKQSPHGQVISNEYINKMNPDIIFAMDRGQAVSGKASSKKVLGNDVLKNVSAIKSGKIIELDPKLWYFSAGSTTTSIMQIEELEKAFKK